MAGSRKEVEDRSDTGSPVPSNQTRRSGRRAKRRKHGKDDFGGGEDEGEDEDEAEADQSIGGNESSASSDEDADGEVWQGDEDDEVERPTKALCIHCGYDEDNDPSPEYETPLECVVCNAFSHKECDSRENNNGGVKSALDEESGKWRCPTCVASGHDSNFIPESTPSQKSRSRRVSAGKEDSRTLRKRGAAEIDEEDDAPVSARRRKRIKQDKVKTNGHVSDDQDGEYEIDDLEHIHGYRETNNAVLPDTLGASSRKNRKLFVPTSSHQDERDVKVTYKKTHRKFNLSITNLTPWKLEKILAAPPKPNTVPPRPRKTSASSTRSARARSTTAADVALVSSTKNTRPPATQNYPAIYDDDKSKPYGGILTEVEAETAKTLPGTDDRARFDRAREEADDERNTRLKLSSSALSHGVNGTGRGDKDKAVEKKGGASKIECIHFGDFEIDTWYAAPYPEEYSRNKVLWICEFCLKYMNSEYVGWRHKMKCDAKYPPGDEVYRDGSISVFEIDGRKNPVYCQNLCLLAKLFLGSKTLYYDVEPFLFYVMTEFNEYGMHFVGYFSKEKRSTSQNNVSCILTLPIHQRKGYGNLLIAFSYLLTRAESKTGSPEKPFSDLGLVSYRNYWKLALCYELRHQKEPLTILDISKRTGMTPDDIICGLEALHALVRDPVTGTYALRLDYTAFQAHIDKWEAKGYVKLNPDALIWTPFLMGRSQAMHLNDAPLSTIAPRAGEKLSAIDEKAEAAAAPTETAGDDGKDDPSVDHDRNGAATVATGEAMDLDALQSVSHAPEEQDMVSKSETEHAAVLQDLPPTPKPATPNIKLGYEPALTGNKWSGPRSPTKSPMQDNNGLVIPPTRFEIVPLVPGLTLKKGRAASSATVRGRKRTSMSPATPRGRTIDTPKLRRGRTKLADTVTLNGTHSPTREQTREIRGSPAISAGAAQDDSHRGKSPSAVNKVMRPTSMDVASEV